MYRDDDRGQSIQIGAVLLFGALIVALAGYQAFVVPQQNEGVEFSHSQTVQNDMQELRNVLASATGEASTRSVSVELGTRYPDRIFAVNPGPASGSLRTAGTSDSSVALRVLNARADGETGDFWTGTSRSYSTGFVTYRPNYNRYRSAPTTVYEHSALGNEFNTGTVALAAPSFVEGRTITLVALNGSLSTTRVGAASVDVRPVSASTRTVSVTNTSSSRVRLELPTRFSESFWREALSDQMAPDGYVESVDVLSGSPYDTLVLELTAGENYTLRLAKAGVGTGVTETDPSYLTDVSGNGSAVPEEGSQQVVVEVRDAYNNPVSGVTVNGSAAGGSLVDTTVTTDENGRATFQYEAPTVDEETEVALNFSYAVDPAATPTFDGTTPENAELTVHVQNTETSGAAGGGSSASYALAWESPTVSEGGASLSNCDDDDCTWDVGKDGDDTLDLTAGTDPEIEGVDLDFALNNSTVGTLSPGVSTTGSSGEGSTTLTASENGTVKLYVFGPGGASDVVNVTVTNVTTSATSGPPTTQNGIRYDGGLTSTGSSSAIQFDISNVDSTFARIEGLRVSVRNGVDDRIFNGNTPYEIDISGGDSDGFRDVSGNPSNKALTADGSTIPLDQNAVLSTSSGGETATVFVGQFGTASGNSFTEYDFGSLSRVSSSDDWDVKIVLELQNRGDVTFYFDES